MSVAEEIPAVAGKIGPEDVPEQSAQQTPEPAWDGINRIPQRILGVTKFCGDDVRYVMNHVLVRQLGGGILLVATDGKALAVAQTHNTHECIRTYLGHLEPEGAKAFPGTFLVPAAFLERAAKMWPKKTLGLVLQDGAAVIGVDQEKISSPLGWGRFPAWEQIAPKGRPIVSVHVDAARMAKILATMVAMTANKENANKVTLHIWGANQPVGIVAKDGEGVIVDVLLMPLT